MPVDVSSEGWRIDRLLTHSHLLVLLFTVLLVGFLAALLWQQRGAVKEGATAGTVAGSRWVLIIAGLFFLLVDGYLFLRSNADVSATLHGHDALLDDPGTVRVQIGARQWAWDIRYAGIDQSFDTEDDPMTVNELVVPKGRAVVFELASNDVVHALYLPNLRVKQDAVPGRVLRNWFRAEELGSFDMACAQHCGVHHYLMGGRVQVLESDDFDEWHRAMSLDAKRMAAEDERAQREEASRAWSGSPWPSPAPTRAWTWPWGTRLHPMPALEVTP